MRYGSDFARAWARRLSFGDVRSKSVLNAISNYVDEHGVAYPSIRTLAEDTDQSDDSVRRRLKDLEEFGVLVRLPRWIDANGKVNNGGAGARTSDELRLVFSVEQAAVDAAIARRNGDPTPLAASEGGVAGEQGEGSNAATPVSTEPKKEESPPTPLKGGLAPDSSDLEEGWPEFEAAFTADGAPIQRHSIGKGLWSGLSADERALVVKAAQGYLAWRRGEKKPPPKMSVQTFLRERDGWVKWAGLAPAPRPVEPPKVFVGEAEPLFAAISVVQAIRTGSYLVAQGVAGHEGRGILTGIPPAPDLLALAPFVGSDRSGWVAIDAESPDGNRRVAAWRERIGKWIGADLPLERAPLIGPDGAPVVKRMDVLGKITEIPIMRQTLRVPQEWPPAKGERVDMQDAAA